MTTKAIFVREGGFSYCGAGGTARVKLRLLLPKSFDCGRTILYKLIA